MALSALELMDLSDKLDGLMGRQQTAAGLDLLDISDEIDQVMLQMGYGASAPQPEPESEQAITPKIVTDFLAGAFLEQYSLDFIETLQSLEQYIGKYLSFADVQRQTAAWIDANIKQDS
ncbi:ddrA [Candidatus Pantoea alvi]|nr:ddrA [Pantoea alvi]